MTEKKGIQGAKENNGQEGKGSQERKRRGRQRMARNGNGKRIANKPAR